MALHWTEKFILANGQFLRKGKDFHRPAKGGSASKHSFPLHLWSSPASAHLTSTSDQAHRVGAKQEEPADLHKEGRCPPSPLTGLLALNQLLTGIFRKMEKHRNRSRKGVFS